MYLLFIFYIFQVKTIFFDKKLQKISTFLSAYILHFSYNPYHLLLPTSRLLSKLSSCYQLG